METAQGEHHCSKGDPAASGVGYVLFFSLHSQGPCTGSQPRVFALLTGFEL